MKPEKISDAMGLIDEDIISSAEQMRNGQKRRKIIRIWGGVAAACLCLAAGVILAAVNLAAPDTVYALAEAEYPQMASYPDEKDFINEKTGVFNNDAFHIQYIAWDNDRNKQMNQPEGYADGLENFFSKSIQQYLSNAGKENRVYSPLNVYMALGMLAEITDGNSRKQILDLLGVNDIEALRTQVSCVWNANYSMDGALTSVLANSLWLNQSVEFEQPVIETLAQNYYASTYQGKMGSEDMNQELQNWLNEQTGGLLKEQVSGVELQSSTILALASTVYFQAKWTDEFLTDKTKEGIFHSESGDVSCDFMYESQNNYYYWSEKYSAVKKGFEGGRIMWLILPDEGVTVDEVLSDENIIEMVWNEKEWENRTSLKVNLYMPKFDAASEFDLVQGLKELGITDVFDGSSSDFTPITTSADGIYVSQASHGARVMVDEEGCTAAAYTAMLLAGASMPLEDEIDFVLDRPFVFVIANKDGLPLFAGVVNQP